MNPGCPTYPKLFVSTRSSSTSKALSSLSSTTGESEPGKAGPGDAGTGNGDSGLSKNPCGNSISVGTGKNVSALPHLLR